MNGTRISPDGDGVSVFARLVRGDSYLPARIDSIARQHGLHAVFLTGALAAADLPIILSMILARIPSAL